MGFCKCDSNTVDDLIEEIVSGDYDSCIRLKNMALSNPLIISKVSVSLKEHLVKALEKSHMHVIANIALSLLELIKGCKENLALLETFVLEVINLFLTQEVDRYVIFVSLASSLV
jgi:hypothetical protein